MKRTEHIAQKPSPKTGLFVVLRVLLHVEGSDTSVLVSRRRGYRLFVTALMATLAVLALTFGSVPASASAPPSLQFNGNGQLQGYGDYGHNKIYVYSTRLYAEADVFVNELNTKWRAEYSTSKSALESGSGTVASSGEEASNTPGGGGNIEFGVPVDQVVSSGPGYDQVHHLTPDTHYYAQFVAENSAGKTVLPFEFTTAPVTRPEVGVMGESGAGGDTPEYELDPPQFGGSATSPTTASFVAKLESNGAATKYSFGYSTSPSGPVTTCTTGRISVAEDFAEPKFNCTGLTPETTYYVHLILTNEKGTVDQTEYEADLVEQSTFTTPTAKPLAFQPASRNITASSAHILANFLPHQEETRWRFEYTTSLLDPAWTVVPGGAGTLSQAQAEGLPEGAGLQVGVTLSGLDPATEYYVRLFAENTSGEGENGYGEPISTESRTFGSFETTAPPTASTFAVHALDGESLRLLGAVDPNSTPTSSEQTVTLAGDPTGGTFTLTLDGQTTVPIAYDAEPRLVANALENLSAGPAVSVEGPDGGPYTVYFGPSSDPLAGKAVSEIEADASGLTPAGASAMVAVTQQGGEGYDAGYRFQYISEDQFKREGVWSGAASTPEVNVGSGDEAKFVTANLPDLTPGETYRYRVVANSTFPGNPVVDGAEHSLSVPVVPIVESSASCPNEALRTGASANLPDCRGYEQLSPVEKEGAREPFTYGGAVGAGVAVGRDGEHAMLEAETSWGASPAAGQSPYFFSHTAETGWGMVAAATQPVTGVDHVRPELFAPDLTSFAFSSFFATSPMTASKEIEYKTGPPGGPYVTVASVPVADSEGTGWVGASQDFSRLFLSLSDHALLGYSTGTRKGADLYEYDDGELRQVNVTGSGAGATIGTCGARIVTGDETAGTVSSAHAVSSDGSRVFFEAVPGSNCAEQRHLYMRVGGETTVDIGAAQFVAANAEGTELLIEKRSGEAREVILYDTETTGEKRLFTLHSQPRLKVSEDLSTIYLLSQERLLPEAPPTVPSGGLFIYRYDILGERLSFIEAADHAVQLAEVSADGRYLYFGAESVQGVPGGIVTGHSETQVYRYDSGESLVQCMSCASSFDPEPKLGSLFGTTGGGGGMLESRTGYPRSEFASSNGDFVFFDTSSALLPSDIDGEVAPETLGTGKGERVSQWFSPSSDVYEWRRYGVDGCAHVQGCLALITNGRGGFMNLFLGTDESGRDALIYTSSELGPRDNDSAGDIYDARIDGGESPAPARPVECEGDACSNPPGAPNDATPSSLTFSGSGNLVESPVATPVVKAKKPKPKKKARVKKKARHGKKAGGSSRKRSGGRVKIVKSSRGSN